MHIFIGTELPPLRGFGMQIVIIGAGASARIALALLEGQNLLRLSTLEFESSLPDKDGTDRYGSHITRCGM